MTLTASAIAFIVVATVVGATLQRVSGLGMGLVVAPLLAVLLGAAPGVLVANATTTVSAFLLTVAVRRAVEWRRALLIGLAAVPGAVLGALLVGALPGAALQVVVGAVVLLGLGTGWLVDHLGRLPHVRRWWVTPGAGLLGGMLNTIAGVAGPVMIVHSRLVRWGQAGFAATMQPVFMVMGGLSVLAKTFVAPVTAWVPPWWLAVVVVGGVLVGIGLGGYLADRVSASAARRTATLVAALGGAAALVRGLLMLG
ncbi:MAG TPA: TSUP family transporter [Ornithinimicrobium sp.]|nr:TSUP family transporter [Ornithinimicrobium sp.]